jgi:hypothetical protein
LKHIDKNVGQLYTEKSNQKLGITVCFLNYTSPSIKINLDMKLSHKNRLYLEDKLLTVYLNEDLSSTPENSLTSNYHKKLFESQIKHGQNTLPINYGDI